MADKPSDTAVTVEPAATGSAESLPAEKASPEPAAQPSETGAGPEKGPFPDVPYPRFEEQTRRAQALEVRLQRLEWAERLEAVAREDPAAARKALEAAASLFASQPEAKPTEQDPLAGLDPELMTTTERVLFEQLREMRGTLGQTVEAAQAAQEAAASKELDVALTQVKTWAETKGYPFDEKQVLQAFDLLNVDGMIQRGATVPQVVSAAYRIWAFDHQPKVVQQQIYTDLQAKKDGTSTGSASKRGTSEKPSINSAEDAVRYALRKLTGSDRD